MPGRAWEAISERLLRIVSGPDVEISLAETSLLIAVLGNPDLSVPAYLSRLDQLADVLKSRVTDQDGVADRLSVLNQLMFNELGFRPNAENYYDPRNSYLSEVLDRRVGIPITLSLVYMELGRRINLPLQGVNFPGHFLVKCEVPGGAIVLDPYSGGISLSVPDLQQRLRDARGGEVSRAIVAQLLVAASNRHVIVRLLSNLKAIFLREKDFDRALVVVNWIVAAVPELTTELRDRGLIYQELQCFRAALADLEQYLKRAPDSEDSVDIRRRVTDLRRETARLN